MQQEFLFLADGAEASGGKIHILGGGVDSHAAAAFPTQLRADIALSFLVSWGETNQQIKLEVLVADLDENVKVKIEADVVVGRPAQARQGQEFRNLIAIKGPFPIEAPGGYKLVMKLDGVEQSPPFHFWVDRAPMPTAKDG
jgi:hypothetical protein